MELVQDLFLTASFALILSFIVAKLVAMAVASREPESEFVESGNAGGGGGGVVMEEVSFEERRMKAEEAFRGRRRTVEFAGEVKEVDQFEGVPVPAHGVEEVEEPLQHHRERRELTEKAPEPETKGPGEKSAAVGFPEKSSGCGEEVSVEKASDSDRQNWEKRGVEEIGAKSETDGVVSTQSEQARAVVCDDIEGKGEARNSDNRGVEEIGAKSETDGVISAQSEQVRAVACDEIKGKGETKNSDNRGVEEIGSKSEADDVVSAQSEQVRACDEIKGKREANEVKLDNCSDEDDWEGIEKSELDDDYTAAEKFGR